MRIGCWVCKQACCHLWTSWIWSILMLWVAENLKNSIRNIPCNKQVTTFLFQTLWKRLRKHREEEYEGDEKRLWLEKVFMTSCISSRGYWKQLRGTLTLHTCQSALNGEIQAISQICREARKWKLMIPKKNVVCLQKHMCPNSCVEPWQTLTEALWRPSVCSAVIPSLRTSLTIPVL